MFSHILRCGVIEALPEHQKDWFDDTMQYLAERFNGLTEQEHAQLRVLGERYCQPVQRVVATPDVAAPATADETVDVTETVDAIETEVASSNA